MCERENDRPFFNSVLSFFSCKMSDVAPRALTHRAALVAGGPYQQMLPRESADMF